jgi:glycosyltransferase involved in cell wall biosynthesis
VRGRTLLSSLEAQTHRDFELIGVDQNPHERLEPILSPYKNVFQVLHFRSEPGLSRAKYLGLGYASGEIIGFPDDDCKYLADLFQRVAQYFAAGGRTTFYAGSRCIRCELDLVARSTVMVTLAVMLAENGNPLEVSQACDSWRVDLPHGLLLVVHTKAAGE